MPRQETPEMLADVLAAYELRDDGHVVTRRIPGVMNQRHGEVVRTMDRGDGSRSLRHAGETELLYARVVFALAYMQWPLGDLLNRDGDPANERPDNLVERDGLSPEELAEIEARYAARRQAAHDAELAAQQAALAAAEAQEKRDRELVERRGENWARSAAVAAQWRGEDNYEDDEPTPVIDTPHDAAAKAAAMREAAARSRAMRPLPAEAADFEQVAEAVALEAEPVTVEAEPVTLAEPVMRRRRLPMREAALT